MTYNSTWIERVKLEHRELSSKIARLEKFLYGKPSGEHPPIDKQDILFLEAQLDAMKSYAGILIARLYYHDIEIDT